MSRFDMILAAATLLAAEAPPQFKGGALPGLPSHKVGGGEVLLEVDVDAGGGVAAVRTLRDTPPYTERMRAAVAGWSFEPAHNAQGQPEPGRVLVAGSFRPSTLMGPAHGEPPQDVAAPSAAVPYPSTTAPALYPPRAQGDGVVMVEVTVGADGVPAAVQVARPAAGFSEAALRAARQWRFRSGSGSSRVYLVFGFRQPVVLTPGVR